MNLSVTANLDLSDPPALTKWSLGLCPFIGISSCYISSDLVIGCSMLNAL